MTFNQNCNAFKATAGSVKLSIYCHVELPKHLLFSHHGAQPARDSYTGCQIE